MNWPSIVRTLREKMLLTQREFGEKLGVSRITVHRWEDGTQNPRSKQKTEIVKLCKEHDVQIKFFYLIKK